MKVDSKKEKILGRKVNYVESADGREKLRMT